MADIKLVIKIPEEIRLALINNIQLSQDQQSICDSYIKHAIIKGTPLNDMFDKLKAEVEDLEYLRYGQPSRKFAIDDCLDVINKYNDINIA